MNKISKIFSVIALLYSGLTMAAVNVSPGNEELYEYISSLPNDKKPIAEYIVKNNPDYSCFNYVNLKEINSVDNIDSNITLNKPIPQNKPEKICGLLSKVVFKEVGSFVTIEVHGSSFSYNDDIKIPIIRDTNNQLIIPESVLIKNLSGQKHAMPSKKRLGARSLDKGDWILNINYDKEKFNSLFSIEWDSEKNIPIIDDSEISLKLVRNGSLLSIKAKQESIKLYTGENHQGKENDIKVFRKLDTSVPYKLETVIDVNSFQDQNVINLGKINPDGFYLLNVSRSVKIQESNGDYLATLNLGQNKIVIQAISNKKIQDFKSPMVNGVSHEVWSLNTFGNVFDINGLEGTNAKIAEVPVEWRNMPTYVRKGDFELVENIKIESVESDLPISTLLNRVTWFDKEGMNFSYDELKIEKNPSNLQFISQNLRDPTVNISGLHLNKIPQVILEDNGLTLIPLKNETELSYSFETKGYTLPTNIWKTDEQSYSWHVNLSPRTRLITTTNDVFSGSWIDKWNLYTMFFLILLIIAYWKIVNYKIAIVVGTSILLFVSIFNSIWTWWILFLIIILAKRVLVYMESKKTDSVKINTINKRMQVLAVILGIIVIFGTYSTYNLIVSEVQYIINPSLELNRTRMHELQESLENAGVDVSLVESNVSADFNPQIMSKSTVYSSSAVIAPQLITEETVKSYQVARPNPNWKTISYDNEVFLKHKMSFVDTEHIKFYIAPTWMVNIMAIVQIFAALILNLIGWLVSYVLFSRNQTVENSKIYLFFFKG